MFLNSLTYTRSEIAGVNKIVNPVRSSAWPIQGGLQSITNTSTVRAVLPTTRQYVEIPQKTMAAVPIVPDNSESKVKTPSPKKVTIKVEPASGKENVTTTPQSIN